jgi:23S rRNA (cytidine1920-2'-O)/16S rRNA (cytidine1409-2'-O)-methyltransferase
LDSLAWSAVRVSRERLDKLLVQRGLSESRARAQAAIAAGEVKVDGAIVDKASAWVALDAVLELASEPRYVSRGGLKLEGALADLGLSLRDQCIADIGASTGGFSDCALAHGARRVYAIDVGHGQLHPRLRADARVVAMEGVNARELTAQSLPERVDLVLVDASFIGLAKLLPALVTLVTEEGALLLLVKPQFEVGREQVGKHGVVREDALRLRAVEEVAQVASTLGFSPRGLAESRVHGPQGNREIFLLLARDSSTG